MFYNLKSRLGQEKFMTMVVARIEDDGRIVYAGAHTDLLIYRAADKSVERAADRRVVARHLRRRRAAHDRSDRSRSHAATSRCFTPTESPNRATRPASATTSTG